MDLLNEEYFMREALKEAMKAYEQDEIPIGAVIECRGRIIARAHNLTEKLNDVTAHAEMQAITAAANSIGGKYLNECTLYVTIEPCLMCAGASYWAQIGRIVYGAQDEKRGYSQVKGKILHPKTRISPGVLEEECAGLMSAFFREKR
jgi:tRNA(adenine34) deaminase